MTGDSHSVGHEPFVMLHLFAARLHVLGLRGDDQGPCGPTFDITYPNDNKPNLVVNGKSSSDIIPCHYKLDRRYIGQGDGRCQVIALCSYVLSFGTPQHAFVMKYIILNDGIVRHSLS